MFQASTTPTQSTINLTKSLRNDVRRRNTMSICTTFLSAPQCGLHSFRRV